MLQNMTKDTHDNDNELLTFTQLGLAAALVINRLRNAQTLRELVHFNEEQEEDRSRDTGGGKSEEQRKRDHSEAVNDRLQSLAAFEKRVAGRNKDRS